MAAMATSLGSAAIDVAGPPALKAGGTGATGRPQLVQNPVLPESGDPQPAQNAIW
jgi:hypothetical protein